MALGKSVALSPASSPPASVSRICERGCFFVPSAKWQGGRRVSRRLTLVGSRKPGPLEICTVGYGSDVGVHLKVEGAEASTHLGDACPSSKARYGELKVGYWSTLWEEGDLTEAVAALDLVVQQEIYVDNYIFYRLLKRCIGQKNLVLGRSVHALSIKSGYESNAFLANHVIRMYASHGRVEEAKRVFIKVAAPNSYVWDSIILAHAENGQPAQAIELYRQMRETGVKPSNRLFVTVLKACARSGDLVAGKEVHADMLGGVEEPNVFVGSCLVDMYAKCGSLEDARRVFDRLLTRDLVTWTAMIAGYAQHGLGQEALALYASMQQGGINPDRVTFVSLLQACASAGALHQGKKLHAEIKQRGLEADLAVGNCLVNFYVKCGRLDDAREVFSKIPSRDVVTWNALINGYAQHSYGHLALQCFEEMQQQGIKPNDVTFGCLLVACSHEGLVNEGQQYFKVLVEDQDLVPDVSHYNCMVDLLGRSGRLDEAEEMLRTMPFENNVVGWRSLLSACKSHGDTDRGRRCFDHVTKMEPEDASAYVLMGNLYANIGQWRDVDRIESLRKAAGAKKKPAKACIEVNSKVHVFSVGEESDLIFFKLRSVNSRLRVEGGHVPHTELVLKTVSEIEKEDALCGHAEKLALAYGLLNTSAGTTLLVTKNLRMCNDCHSSTKIMSRLENREIIVRDAHRVHHFWGGTCSCGDRH